MINKERLARVRSELVERIKELSKGENLLPSDYVKGDEADIASLCQDEEVAVGRINNEEYLSAQIIRAIEKIDEGTYGKCDFCNEGIPSKRLKAIPYATACVTCQQDLENGHLKKLQNKDYYYQKLRRLTGLTERNPLHQTDCPLCAVDRVVRLV